MRLKFGVQKSVQFSMKTSNTIPAQTTVTLSHTAIRQKRAVCLHTMTTVPHLIFERNYEQIEAVDTDENLYIDTGYLHTKNTRLLIDCIPFLSSHTKTFPFLFGTKGGSRYWDSHAWGLGMNGTSVLYARGHNTNTSTPVAFDGTKRSTVMFWGGDMSVQYADGSSVDFTDERAVVDDGILPLWLFNFSDADTTYCSKTRFYNCRIYEAEKLVRDFIPVRRKTGGIVLFDKVENRSYEPQGGNFTEVTT